jgi:hypothetical protein
MTGFLAGCASAPKPGEFSSREMMLSACPSGFTKKVSGSVWTKIESKEMNGQFPASVLVDYPRSLAVEVTNLIGSPQAWLKIEGGKTELRFTAENEKEYGQSRARDVLGGLPLEIAPRLFAGGVPCPSADKNQDIRVKQADEGGLEVEVLDLRTRTKTRYVYTFLRHEGKPWVKTVEWEKTVRTPTGEGTQLVKILREEPMDPDGGPRRWSASSSSGEIRVRWKDRKIMP